MKTRLSLHLSILTLIIFCIVISPKAKGNEYTNDTTRWPLPDWESLSTKDHMKSKECKNFIQMAVNNENFLTDGLIIIKDGLIHYEYYDSKHGPETLHPLWSVSKTITGTLLGITERDGRINLNTELSEFYHHDEYDSNFEKITIKNLLYMDDGYIWNEGIKDVSKNPVISMLYGIGRIDMAKYATNRKIIQEGPTYKWNYSTGTPTITMGILKKIYGENDSDMPWRTLFNPLGMTSVVFERDRSGTFIGGSAVFATPRDLGKLGYLFLNNGFWNGEILLPQEWIQKMLTPSPGYISPGTVIKDISKDGVYGGSIWLNREVKKGQGIPYPNVPEDMYMAIGLMGQFLIMIPSTKMIIVRTGHDLEFHSKINEFVSRAIQCFHDPKHRVGKSKSTRGKMDMSIGKLIKNVKNAMQANTLQASIAKNICSCHFVSKMDIPSCLKRNNMSLSRFLTKMYVSETKELNGERSIQVRLSRFARIFKLHRGNSAKAYFNPSQKEFGCTLK